MRRRLTILLALGAILLTGCTPVTIPSGTGEAFHVLRKIDERVVVVRDPKTSQCFVASRSSSSYWTYAYLPGPQCEEQRRVAK